jgi:glycosyltransferase involved in cell wall biosynthesis
MLSDVTLIIADAPPLLGLTQRVQQLAIRLSRTVEGRLWYFDEPGNIATVFLSPEKPLSNLWSWVEGPRRDPDFGALHFVPPAGLPFGYHVRWVNQWNHFWYRTMLGTRYRKAKGKTVLIVCNVLGLGWLGKLGEDVSIYDCADEISEFRQARLRREAVQAQERELARRVDAVVTTSQPLFDSKAPLASRCELIRNAADVAHFNKALKAGPRPSDIALLSKPIVGFYGFLADWLDWSLIKAVVEEGSEFDWVFIGPTTRDLPDLKKLANFHALGRKPYDELPAYLSHFACAHMPFDRTPLTVNVNPVKVYEYLAGGAPVVATPLPELEAFRDVLEVAATPGEYLSAIRRSIQTNTPEKRLARAKRVETETWDDRVERYCRLISELL